MWSAIRRPVAQTLTHQRPLKTLSGLLPNSQIATFSTTKYPHSDSLTLPPPSRPSSFIRRVALMSTIAAAAIGGTIFTDISTVNNSPATATLPSPPAAESHPTLAPLTHEFVAPKPTFWSRVRSLWIPTSATQLYEAERRTFESILYPYESKLVEIEPDEVMKEDGVWKINTLTVTNPHLEPSTPVVLLHGFGAGIGLSLSNFNHFGSIFPRVDYVDMLGWGRSSRVDFDDYLKYKLKAKGIKKRKGHEQEYLQAVATIASDFTVDSLEAWRIKQGHEKIVLIGHSMGGYLSGAYALKYPERVESLILASPIGVPVAKELDISRWSWTARKIIGVARFAWWDAGVTPQSIVRGLGRFGPKPVTGYVTRRFASSDAELAERDANPPRPRPAGFSATSLDSANTDLAVGEESRSGSNEAGAALELDDTVGAAQKLAQAANEQGNLFDKTIVADYLYHLCAQPGSGEFAFARLFDQSGFAYNPLIQSLPSISNSQLPPNRRVPITFLYGNHDWMDVQAGLATTAIINEQGGRAQTLDIPRAGHQMMVDNPKGFAQRIQQAVNWSKQQ